VAAHSSQVPVLVALTLFSSADFLLLFYMLFVCFFFLFFFSLVAWDIVFLFGKLMYLELCWVFSCLESLFRILTVFLLLLPSFGDCWRLQVGLQLDLS